MPRLALSLLALFCLSGAFAAVERQEGKLVLSGTTWSATFSEKDGSLLALSQRGMDGAILRGGEQGLWQVSFADNTALDATQLLAQGGSFQWAPLAGDQGLTLTYNGADLKLVVRAEARPDGLDFRATVTPAAKTLLGLAVPGRLRFAPEDVRRFVTPGNGNNSVGWALNSRFFAAQPQDKPSGWTTEVTGSAGYVALFGGNLDQRPDRDPAVALQSTPQSSDWLGEALTKRLPTQQATVNRPSTRAQVDLVLADSPNGPYFGASRLGGSGALWRLGGGVGDDERDFAADLVTAVLRKLSDAPPTGRTRVGLIALRHGPQAGGWANVPVATWRDRMRALPAVRAGKLGFVELTTPTQLFAALGGDDYLAILNPYGESAPVPLDGDMAATVAAIGRFVRAGGNWFETGGFPFHYALRPLRYLHLGTSYPAAFADFMHLEARGGAAALYGVQTLQKTPWTRDPSQIFVPGRLECGGDEQGGWLERGFGTFVPAGQTWLSPVVRVQVGATAPQALQAYATATGLSRKLQDKLSPATLAKLRNSVLVYYAGNAREKTANLDKLPVPTLVHFADYLKGGFDKEYPDHLPPSAWFGTPEEMRAFFDRAHQLGHLVMPYTNPTWWCDHPRGPTFIREGEAPLLKDLQGKPIYERYSQNDGWTICHWHPAVQAANRQTVREFTQDYPVDMLFQDQCGARTWHYDTNPASPTPYAYTEGLISMVAEDSQTKPLSTESGWDRVAHYETQLCGMTWGLVPTTGGPSWRHLLKYDYPPETWDIYPLAEYLTHDQVVLVHHDLGQFVTNREVLTWTLGLGYSLSYRANAADLARPRSREWLLWLDRVQKSVCSRYVGQPLTAFTHDRGPQPTTEDDGVIQARYGEVALVANLGAAARTVEGAELAAYGFRATAPGLVAGNLAQLGGASDDDEGFCFVSEARGSQAEVWVYAPARQQTAVELPAGVKGTVRVTFDGQKPLTAQVSKSVLKLPLPDRTDETRLTAPAALAGKAPRDWGGKLALGVLDLGPGVGLSWTDTGPQEWFDALSRAAWVRQAGLPVKRLDSYAALQAALAAGPTQWLTIINPYGEQFPSPGPGRWKEALEAIRAYVENGGCWWETAGYSFYAALYHDGAQWQRENVGPAGLSYLGVPVGGGEIDAPAEPLSVPPAARAWLGADLAARVAQATSPVNRSAPRGFEDPGHVALVSGEEGDFIGGYRLRGWGWLWRVGGFHPSPDVVLPVAVQALEHLYTTPPPPPAAGGLRYLWHATVKPG